MSKYLPQISQIYAENISVIQRNLRETQRHIIRNTTLVSDLKSQDPRLMTIKKNLE